MAFLVSDELAFTCAHVIAAALRTPEGRRPADEQQIALDLALSGNRQSVTALVHRWDGQRDIAVLRLDRRLAEAGPVRLVRAGDVWHHPIRVFGFPLHRDEGVWHSGRLLDRQGGGWIQTEMASAHGYRVSRGFSGGPVWDGQLNGVVGMMVAAELDGPAVAYLIPSATLLSAWPELELPSVRESPFRPLAALTEADARCFFGRARETAEVAAQVRKEPVVTLVGPSGSGKSSLAMAGVVPELRAYGYAAAVMRPASDADGTPLTPIAALAAALLPLLEPGLPRTERRGRRQQLADELRAEPHPVVAEVLRVTGSRRLLLVIDQCEEALTVPEPETAALTHLLAAGNLAARIRVLTTLRADFLEPALSHPSLGPLVQAKIHALRPMNRDQLREVIDQPVRDDLRVSYAEGLADRILRDTGDAPGALPLLVMALDLLWRAQNAQGQLTHETYELTGGVSGALHSEAERAWAENVREAEEPAARRLFTRLVQIPFTGSGAVTRRPAGRFELTPPEWEIAQRLAATRLLVADSGESVELAHEALITAWPRLAGWVVEDHEFLAWRESTRIDLARWRQAGEPAELLPAPVTLAAAQRWLSERAEDISPAEREFLEQGLRRRRSAVRRRRRLFSAVGLISVLALVLGVLFGYQREVSAEQRAAADSRALATLATDQRQEDPALAVKLALAAYRRSPTGEAKNTLLRFYLRYRNTTRILSSDLGDVADFRASRDGGVILARTTSNRATVYTRALHGTVRTARFGEGYVLNPLVSGDGSRIGYIWADGTSLGIYWSDIRPGGTWPPGKPQRLTTEEPEIINGLHETEFAQLSDDGRLLVAGSDTSVAWWDLDKRSFGGRVKLPQARGGRGLAGVWFGPDDDTLVVLAEVSYAKQKVMVVDRRTGTVRGIADSVDDAVISPDGSAVATCRSFDGGAVYTGLSIPDGSTLGRYADSSAGCHTVALGAKGRLLAIGLTTKAVIDLPHGKALADFAEPDDSDASPVGYARLVDSGTKPLLVTATSSGVFSTETSTLPAQNASRLDLTPDGRRIVAVLKDGTALQLRTAGAEKDLITEAPRLRPYWPSEDPVVFNEKGTLLADREAVNKVVVREAASLRRLAVISTATPPTRAGSDKQPSLDYLFDQSGHLVTLSGTVLQRWDATTGRPVDAHSLASLLGSPVDPTRTPLALNTYPKPDRVAVVRLGDPHVRVLELSSGRVSAQYQTHHTDLFAVAFDSTGRHFAVLRQGRVIEMWGTDPLRRKIGPLPSISFPAVARFLDDSGRYLVASDNKIRVYRVDEERNDLAYDLGPSDDLDISTPQYTFLDASLDGRTLLYYATRDNIVYPLKTDPDVWADALCRTLGGTGLTAGERDAQPVPVPAETVCP
ncbi:nSTAND1 domain-containing NTPase [Streptomyces eurythermus]|uniref:nSTAND1 domain-containing NTPase n=1 Tax=Streptomyces eurythermus TaxID=42237 RepID=UPI0033DA86BE